MEGGSQDRHRRGDHRPFDPEYDENSGFSIEPLYVDRFYAVVSAESPFAVRDCVDVDELLGSGWSSPTAIRPSRIRRWAGPAPLSRFTAFSKCGGVQAGGGGERHDPPSCRESRQLGDLYENTGLIRRIRVTGFDTRLTNYLLLRRPQRHERNGAYPAGKKSGISFTVSCRSSSAQMM